MQIYHNVNNNNNNNLYKEDSAHDKIDSQPNDFNQSTSQSLEHNQKRSPPPPPPLNNNNQEIIIKSSGKSKITKTATQLTRANTNFLRSLGYRVRQYRKPQNNNNNSNNE